MSHNTEECAKFEEKLTFGSKNDMGNSLQHIKFQLKKYQYVLAEAMYFLDKSNQSTFWAFHCLSEVFQIHHVIFETRSQFLQKLCTILYIISQLKHTCKV